MAYKIKGDLEVKRDLHASGSVSIGSQAYPGLTGSLTLSGSSLITDLNNSNVNSIILTGSFSLSTASNQKPGGSYVWLVKQDGTGDHTLTFDTNYFTIIGSNTTIITGSNKTTVLSGISDGSKIFLAIAGDES